MAPTVLGELRPPNGRTKIVGVAGSLLEDFVGDAIVNAANEGCVGGFGIDERVNRAAGGHRMREARRALGGCPTGRAKSTDAFGDLRERCCRYVIHAVGPSYRRRYGDDDVDVDARDALLRSAYRDALREARNLGDVETLGFCLLSAGVFRGERSLRDVVAIAVDALSEETDDDDDRLETVTIYAYTKEEQEALASVLRDRGACV